MMAAWDAVSIALPNSMHAFSDCIRKDRQPEPSGEEGLRHIRIVEALYKSAKTGRAVRFAPYRPVTQPAGRQRIRTHWHP
jgi:glucose-fructose oxidoreductase